MKEVYEKASLSIIFFANCDDVTTTSTSDPWGNDIPWEPQE